MNIYYILYVRFWEYSDELNTYGFVWCLECFYYRDLVFNFQVESFLVFLNIISLWVIIFDILIFLLSLGVLFVENQMFILYSWVRVGVRVTFYLS